MNLEEWKNEFANKGWTLSVMESLTAGGCQALLGSIPGISAVFKGGGVSYTNEAKMKFGVSKEVLATKGAISAECAKEMAEAIRQFMGTTWGLSMTGVAGPTKAEGKPVGTVFIGLSNGETTKVWQEHFSGSRTEIQQQTITAACRHLMETSIK